MRRVYNRSRFTRIARVGSQEIRLEPGVNLVDDETFASPVVTHLLGLGVLREQPLPTADQDFTGALPEDTTSLTEAAALRAIAAVHVGDEQRLRNWRGNEPRPRVRAAIDNALRNLTLSVPGNLLRD